ncbi:MAG: hypothetical protein IE883_08075, partial [Epsilonproteobacteria bacterium]|nr:hypothetical protein [Campylobacterota bacterium]
MQYSIETDRIGQGFWLHLRASGDGLEIAEHDLPTPNYYQRIDEGSYRVAWLLNGYFGTTKSRAYLNDIIARLSIALPIVNRLDFAPSKFEGVGHELKEFSSLPSLPRRTETSPNAHKRDDAIFWAIKLESIHRIRMYGWLDHDALWDWAHDIFITKAKDKSTLKAKVR